MRRLWERIEAQTAQAAAAAGAGARADRLEARVKGRYLVLDQKARQLSLTQEGMLVLFGCAGWGGERGGVSFAVSCRLCRRRRRRAFCRHIERHSTAGQPGKALHRSPNNAQHPQQPMQQ